MIPAERVYDEPKAKGTRILIDRLWPRGVKKSDAHVDIWAKDLAPSSALRQWMHADPEKRFKEFEKRYLAELRANRAAARALMAEPGKRIVLVTAVKDIERSHVPTLRRFLVGLASRT